MFRAASNDQRLAVLNAHPDLAGKLASAGKLTDESTQEQAGAGLNLLTDQERETFQALNAQYVERHGFPFIIAVRDHTKASIMEAFRYSCISRPPLPSHFGYGSNEMSGFSAALSFRVEITWLNAVGRFGRSVAKSSSS